MNGESQVESRAIKGRQESARRIAVHAVALLQCGILFTASISTYLLPVRQDFEWQIFLFLALACLALFRPLIRSLREQDRNKETLYSTILICIGLLAFLQRLAFAYWGPLLDDTSVYMFRPVLVFFPLLTLAAVSLGRASLAIKVCWIAWAAMTAITLSGVFMHPGMTPQRDGFVFSLLWLLVAVPLFIGLLHTIPRYEDVLFASERELQQAQAAAALAQQLEASEHRYKVAIQGLQVGVWERRDQSYWWSPRLYELIGYTPEQKPASGDSVRSLVHPEDLEKVMHASTRSQQSLGIFNVNCRLLTRHEGYRWFNIRAQWERDLDGGWSGVAGAIADIHDRITAESALQKAQDELRQMAYSDPLTAVGNRRAFDERLNSELDRSQRSGADLSLALIDLDYFKLFNDRYGHPAGDECLRLVAKALRECINRPADFIARIGGEEFAVLLPETDLDGARLVAADIAKAIAALDIPHAGSDFGKVTCSIGLECSARSGIDLKSLFDNADAALYRAKKSGRNCIVHL